MISTIDRTVAPEPVADPLPDRDDLARLRRDRIRRVVVWTTTALATSASLTGAALILWTVSR